MLASRINAKHISLGSLVADERLSLGFDRKRETLIADLDRLSERVKEIIEESTGDVIVEGHYAADVVDPKDVYIVFVLRKDPEELNGVLRSRNYGEDKVRENLAAEILDICLYEAVKRCGVEKVCEVDLSRRNIEEAVEEILQVLEGKKKRRVGIVDWLGKLESEGKLDEYLKDI